MLSTLESPEIAESIRARCRVRYTCPVDEVDERLSESMLRSIRMIPQPNTPQPLTIPPNEPDQILPLPPLTLSVPVENDSDPSSPTSPLGPLPEEAAQDDAEYYAQRARLATTHSIVYEDNHEDNNAIPQVEHARLASHRDTEYHIRAGEWSNQEDNYRMIKEPSVQVSSTDRRDETNVPLPPTPPDNGNAIPTALSTLSGFALETQDPLALQEDLLG